MIVCFTVVKSFYENQIGLYTVLCPALTGRFEACSSVELKMQGSPGAVVGSPGCSGGAARHVLRWLRCKSLFGLRVNLL